MEDKSKTQNQVPPKGFRLPVKPTAQRTTFRLKESTIKELTLLAKHYSRTQKDMLDFLWGVFNTLLPGEQIQEELNSTDGWDPKNRIRKVFVISEKSLKQLNQTAEKLDKPRDLLVERMIGFGRKITELVAQKEQEKYEAAEAFAIQLRNQVDQAEQELEKIIGNDGDYEVMEKMGAIYFYAEDLLSTIQGKLQHSKRMEVIQNEND